jgi:transcriptional regulator with XRE-family HTH domain
MGDKHFPYKMLGIKLRRLREAAKQTLAQVSGAVEIDTQKLMNIEAGREQPSEDILLLLISHFDVPDKDALGLWESAGYGANDVPETDYLPKQQIFMVMPFDNRILYSDNAGVEINDSGVVINFLQSHGNQPIPVSRIGMSKEQAQKLLLALTHSIKQASLPKVPKTLPAQTRKTTTDEPKNR